MLPGRMQTLIDKFLSKLLIDFINNHAPGQKTQVQVSVSVSVGVNVNVNISVAVEAS